MDFATYTTNAKRTEQLLPQEKVFNFQAFTNTILLFAEAGKLLNLWKRKIFYNRKELSPEQRKVLVETLSSMANRVNRMKFQALGDLHRNEEEIPRIEDQKTDLSWRTIHGLIGCATEAGEMMENLGASMLSGQFDRVNLIEEIGDQEWYRAILIDSIDATEDEIRERNYQKLKARFGDEFSEERAVNRNLAVEYETLR